jgi:hypothetical protein
MYGGAEDGGEPVKQYTTASGNIALGKRSSFLPSGGAEVKAYRHTTQFPYRPRRIADASSEGCVPVNTTPPRTSWRCTKAGAASAPAFAMVGRRGTGSLTRHPLRHPLRARSPWAQRASAHLCRLHRHTQGAGSPAHARDRAEGRPAEREMFRQPESSLSPTCGSRTFGTCSQPHGARSSSRSVNCKRFSATPQARR